MNTSIRSRVLEYLKSRGGCAYATEVKEHLGVSWTEVMQALAELEAEEHIYRDGEPLDLTKPIATSRWCTSRSMIEEPMAAEPLGEVVAIVASPALVKRVSRTPLVMGLPEFLESFVCSSANDGMRIMMPYLSGLAGYLFARCLDRLSSLKYLRIMTERDESNIRTLKRLEQYLSNLEVAYATRYEKESIEGREVWVKVEGAHAKLIIVDDRYALVGTFNLTEVHLLSNYDIGVLVRGPAVKLIVRLYDELWSSVAGMGGADH